MGLLYIFTKPIYIQKQFCKVIKLFAMNTKIVLEVISITPDSGLSNGPLAYLIGGIIALLILGYLIYTLLHPDKF
jgi:K+-transporting ATPase KdpF subunit